MSTETVSLLSSTIETEPQAFATKVKWPCTGFCYMVIQNKSKLLDLYKTRSEQAYYEFILKLIKEAGIRKMSNSNIPYKGEYLNQDTVKKDFPNIVKKMEFIEMNTVDPEGSEYAKNTLFLQLFTLQLGDCMMIIRSEETFLIIKIDNDAYLVVDSHKDRHGTVDTIKAVQYITRFNIYKGLVQIGVYKE